MYEDLEPIAQLKLAKIIESSSKDTQGKLTNLITQHAHRGIVGYSGPLEAAKAKIRVEGAERLCRAVYDIWLELICRRKQSITREDINFITEKVEKCAQAQTRNIQATQRTSPDPPVGAQSSIVAQAERQISSVVGDIRRELKIKLREQEAFPPRVGVISNDVFVVVAASDDLAPLIREAIQPAIRDNALQPFIMTAREPETTIGGEILERIESCQLLIADLTHERPNCYYEVGYAQAKGKKVIFAARRDHDPRRPGRTADDPKVHFDLDQHKFSFWDAGEWSKLRSELRDRIGDYLRRLQVATEDKGRSGEAVVQEVLKYMRETQSSAHGRVIFHIKAIAQEMGWRVEDVEAVVSNLLIKGSVAEYGGGFVLVEQESKWQEKLVLDFMKNVHPRSHYKVDEIAAGVTLCKRDTSNTLERLEAQARVRRTKIDEVIGGYLWILDELEL